MFRTRKVFIIVVMLIVALLTYLSINYSSYKEEKEFVNTLRISNELKLLTIFFINLKDSGEDFNSENAKEKLNEFAKEYDLFCLKYGYNLVIDVKKSHVTLYSFGVDEKDDNAKVLVYNKSFETADGDLHLNETTFYEFLFNSNKDIMLLNKEIFKSTRG